MKRSTRDLRTAWSWSLPWNIDADGQIRRYAERSVEDTVRLVLEVIPGERPLLPDFGWRAHLLSPLYGPNRKAIAGLLAEEALARWIPGLQIDRVDVMDVTPVTEGGVYEAVLEVRRLGYSHRVRVKLRNTDLNHHGGL